MTTRAAEAPTAYAPDTGEADEAARVTVPHRAATAEPDRPDVSARLRGRVGTGRVMVGESGVRGAPDARALEGAPVDAVLVGEPLMRAGDPGATIKELVG